MGPPRGTQPLAGIRRVTPLPRSDSPRPFVTARVLVGKKATDQFVCCRSSIADSEVSFWFVMIIISDIIIIVSMITINIITIH